MPALGIAFSPCPAGLDPASHPVKQVGTQRVALNILFHSLKIKRHEEVNLGGYPQNHHRRSLCRSGSHRCQCLRVIGCHQRTDPPLRHTESDLWPPPEGGERAVALPYCFPVFPIFPLPLFLVQAQLLLAISVRETMFNNTWVF